MAAIELTSHVSPGSQWLYILGSLWSTQNNSAATHSRLLCILPLAIRAAVPAWVNNMEAWAAASKKGQRIGGG